jgi:hypothetical protein
VKRILKEPLLHFLVLGMGVFLAYDLTSRSITSGARGEIVVTAGQVEHLAAGFTKAWQRPPTDAELKGLIDDWVREEIATREAMALGLDKDDTVIRRRLRQKLEFVSDDIAAQAEPTDADLNAYLRAHPDSFRVEPRLTFSQVYLNPTKHGGHLARDAAEVLARLKQAGAAADLAALGDSFLLEPTFRSVPTSEVAKQFGDGFAAQLGELTPGVWQGPVASGYGVHLAALAEARDAVRREWANARRLEASRRFYEEMLKRYTVTVEGPEPPTGQKTLAAAK